MNAMPNKPNYVTPTGKLRLLAAIVLCCIADEENWYWTLADDTAF